MRIENQYSLLFVTATKVIENDYTQSWKGLNLAVGAGTSYYGAETIAELDQYCSDNGLTDPDNLVSPH